MCVYEVLGQYYEHATTFNENGECLTCLPVEIILLKDLLDFV